MYTAYITVLSRSARARGRGAEAKREPRECASQDGAGRVRTAADVKRVLDSTVASAEVEAVELLQQVCSRGGRRSAVQMFGHALTQKDDPMGRSPLILAVDYRLPACARAMLEALDAADGPAASAVVDSTGRSLVLPS